MISHGPSSKTNLTIPDSIHIMVKSGRTICIFYSHYYSHYIIPLPPVNWNRPCQIGVGRWICTKKWTILTVSMWITQMVTHWTSFNWLWINTYTMFRGWWTSIKTSYWMMFTEGVQGNLTHPPMISRWSQANWRPRPSKPPPRTWPVATPWRLGGLGEDGSLQLCYMYI